MRTMHVGLAIGLVLAPALAGACDLKPVRLVNGAATVGDVSVALGEGIPTQAPDAWQGPVRISVGAGPACSASDAVSIIEQPITLAGDVLYVPTYSGSSSIVYALDVKTCGVIWRSRDFVGSTAFRHGTLIMGRRRVHLDAACRPVP